MMAKQISEIRWQRFKISKQLQAEWLVNPVLEEAGSNLSRRKDATIES
jgi:hypothetical protein